MWKGFVVVVLLANICQGEGMTIVPANQKVSEYSPVLFTCVTDLPNVTITWEMKNKKNWTPITNGQDGFQLTSGNGLSSLKIVRAEVKKHKRLYRCLATSQTNPDDISSSSDAKLKIARIQRLHAQFPHILPIKSEADILIPVQEPNTVAMQCRSTLGTSVRGIKWRWIKDEHIDLTLQPDYPSRIQIEENGILRIKDLSKSDSGYYTCVATNKQGTSYGTPFRMNVAEAVNDGRCHTSDGQVLEVGQEYSPDNDPCHTCECKEGNQLLCRMVACAPELACGGRGYTKIPGTCCQFTCDGEPTRVQAVEEGTCISEDGQVLQVGQEYKPNNKPCQTCRCYGGNSLICRSIACAAPSCEGRGYTRTPGTCCDYKCDEPTRVQVRNDSTESCIDRDGRSVGAGTFMPTDDPCLRCICVNGRKGPCRVTDCSVPTCPIFTRSRDRCCEYDCIEAPEEVKAIDPDMCIDRDGLKVAHGAVYLPDDDPCLRCVCNHGSIGGCMSVACKEPTCPNFVTSKDKCCSFTCIERVAGSEEPQAFVDSCKDVYGNRVLNGSTYQPNRNPCESCMCVNGRAELCAESVCDAPPCRNYILIEDTCCGFICPNNGTQTSTPPVKVNIRSGEVFVQQVGPSSALVQWSYPNISLETIESTIVTFRPVVHDRHGNKTLMMNTTNEAALIDDLDPNMVYEVSAMSRQGDMYMMSTLPEFSLDGRATNSLRLSDAVGVVFESRGAIDYGDFSLPRRFERVITDEKFVVSINTASFHRTVVAFYDQAPCPKDLCGLIRFFIYGVDGKLNNVMSLLFTDDKDFVWAKAHL